MTNLSQIELLFFKPDDSDSSTKMPPRLQFSQLQQSFLATEFHRRRGSTRDYKMNHLYLSRKMMLDFSLSAVIFATSTKGSFFLRHTVLEKLIFGRGGHFCSSQPHNCPLAD